MELKKQIIRVTGKPPYCNTGVQRTRFFMDAFITLDTFYLHVKYPYRDVFDRWFSPVANLDYRILKQGQLVDDFVVRNGSSGYKVSVWDHDARAYLSEQVDEKCGEGKGMGVWIQLGPKFLIEHSDNLHQAVKEFAYSIGILKDYPISISRIDIAIDLLNVSMADQNVNTWSQNWVGRSKLSGVFYNSRTGILETLYIGSRKSPVFLRLYDKVAQSIAEGDIEYWKDVWKGFEGAVTRVEWEIKPKDGNFSGDLKDFSLFNGFSIRELLNYLMDWGRLCEPDPDDTNRRRWKDSEFWSSLRSIVELWADGITWPTSRFGKEFHGLSEAYIKFVSGTISGAMARFNEDNPTISELLTGLDSKGETWEKIKRKAESKASVIRKL